MRTSRLVVSFSPSLDIPAFSTLPAHPLLLSPAHPLACSSHSPALLSRQHTRLTAFPHTRLFAISRFPASSPASKSRVLACSKSRLFTRSSNSPLDAIPAQTTSKIGRRPSTLYAPAVYDLHARLTRHAHTISHSSRSMPCRLDAMSSLSLTPSPILTTLVTRPPLTPTLPSSPRAGASFSSSHTCHRLHTLPSYLAAAPPTANTPALVSSPHIRLRHPSMRAQPYAQTPRPFQPSTSMLSTASVHPCLLDVMHYRHPVTYTLSALEPSLALLMSGTSFPVSLNIGAPRSQPLRSPLPRPADTLALKFTRTQATRHAPPPCPSTSLLSTARIAHPHPLDDTHHRHSVIRPLQVLIPPSSSCPRAHLPDPTHPLLPS